MISECKDAASILDLISEVAARRPNAIALEADGEQLRYADLDARSNHVAEQLARMGAGSGDVIPVALERSLGSVIAALGIMKAGAAYLPLDPSWPLARLRFAIADSGAVAVLASASLYAQLALDIPNLELSERRTAVWGGVAVRAAGVQPEDLAYLIYTSGSTGTPKGVEITHANLSHLVRWHRTAFAVTDRDRASHLAGLGFDAAVWEIWPHLCAGATVCLAPDAARFAPSTLKDWLLREGITLAYVPTVHTAELASMEWPVNTALRYLLTGGDALHHFPARGLPFTVVNNYGPTECTVVATSAPALPGQGGTPSIGKPIPGNHCYLLNDRGELVAPGDVGEIYIGGEGVGRGYRNLPESTANAFLADPFSPLREARMFKTGDLGVELPNGEIVFRGRADRQVKIRGYRIELDEVSSVLSRSPKVRFATVAAETRGGSDPRLVAYVLPTGDAGRLTTSELQRHLLTALPEYMVPAIFLRLESLPLSANGKVDLRLLPNGDEGPRLPSEAAGTPVGDLQGGLLALMCELLGDENLTPEDNFFLAGGHSLLGMQLVLRVRKAFGVNLSLRQLFEAPTVVELAYMLEGLLEQGRLTVIWKELLGRAPGTPDEDFFELGGDLEKLLLLQQRLGEGGLTLPVEDLAGSPTIRLQAELIRKQAAGLPVQGTGVLPLRSEGCRQQMYWIHYPNPDFAKALREEQPFFSLVLTEADLRSMHKNPTMGEIAACFVRKLVELRPQAPFMLGGLCVGGLLAFEIARQLKETGHEISLLVLLDTPDPGFLKGGQRPRFSMGHARYLARRVGKLGPKMSLEKVREHLTKRYRPLGRFGTENDVVQQHVERAAADYTLAPYDGRALLVLASDCSPSLDFETSWREVIPGGLQVDYVHLHHTDLMLPHNVQIVADTITPYLLPRTERRENATLGHVN